MRSLRVKESGAGRSSWTVARKADPNASWKKLIVELRKAGGTTAEDLKRLKVVSGKNELYLE